MAVVVGRMLAVLEAQTAQFEARMDAAAQQLNRMTSTSATTRRAVGQMRVGLEQLAFSGLGLLPPAAARAGAALTTVFVGSPVVLAITAMAAALGVLGMAFEHAAKKAQELVEQDRRVREFRRSHLEMLAGLGGDVRRTPGEELAALQQRRASVQRLIAERAAIAGAVPSVVGQLTGKVDPLAQRAQQEIDALTTSLLALNSAIRDMTFEPFRRQFADFVADLESRRVTGLEFRPGALRARGGGQFPAFGDVAGMRPRDLHFLPRDPFAGISTHFGRGTTPDAPARGQFRVTPEFAQMLLFSMMSMRGGGAGGILGGLGGLTTAAAGLPGIAGKAAAGPLGWVGFGLSALGTIFTSNADKNADKIIKAIDRMAKEVGLERVTVVFTGPDGHQTRKTLAELENSDAVERVAGPAGTTG